MGLDDYAMERAGHAPPERTISLSLEEETPPEIQALAEKEQRQFQNRLVMMTWARTTIPTEDGEDYVWFLCYRVSHRIETRWMTTVRFAVCANAEGQGVTGGIAHTYFSDEDPDGA